MITLPRRSLLAGTALLAGTIRRARADAAPVRMALIAPLSGVSAVTGKPVRLGAEVAADYVNRTGGAGGRKIELVVRDDHGDPKQSVAAVRELQGDGINLFVGAPLTATAMAVTAVMPSLDSVYIATGTNADQLTHELYNPHFFSVADNNFTRCRAYALLMAQKFPDITRWGAIFPDVAAGHSAWDPMSAWLKKYYADHGKQIEILDPVLTSMGVTDFKPQLARLMASPIEGMLSVLFGADAITFFQQAKSFGLDAKLKALGDYALNLDIPKALGRNTPAGIWSVTQWYYGAHENNALSRDLLAQSIARNQDPYPPGITALGHSGVMAFAAAIAKAGSSATPQVIAALEGLSVDTPRGPISLRREDHQAFGGIDFIRMAPKQADPGWEVSDFAIMQGPELSNPPTPGVALKM